VFSISVNKKKWLFVIKTVDVSSTSCYISQMSQRYNERQTKKNKLSRKVCLTSSTTSGNIYEVVKKTTNKNKLRPLKTEQSKNNKLCTAVDDQGEPKETKVEIIIR